MDTFVVKQATVISFLLSERSVVTGSGGGGSIKGGRGYVREVEITTTHQVRRDIWVKHPDGTDECIILTGVELPVREGHVLHLLYAGNELWAARNMTAKQEVWLKSVDGMVGHPPSRFMLICAFLASLIILIVAGLWSYAKLTSEPFIEGI